MGNKIVIFCSKLDIGNNFLKNLVGEMEYKDVKKMTLTALGGTAKLFDGTEYEVKPVSRCVRGMRINTAYIQKNAVSEEYIKSEILPLFFEAPNIIYF